MLKLFGPKPIRLHGRLVIVPHRFALTGVVVLKLPGRYFQLSQLLVECSIDSALYGRLDLLPYPRRDGREIGYNCSGSVFGRHGASLFRNTVVLKAKGGGGKVQSGVQRGDALNREPNQWGESQPDTPAS